MSNYEELCDLVEDLIGVLHRQAKEIQRVESRLAQVSTHMHRGAEIHVIISELSELELRIKKLKG